MIAALILAFLPSLALAQYTCTTCTDYYGYNGYWCNGACFTSSSGSVCSSASPSCKASFTSECGYISASCPTGGSTTTTGVSTPCTTCTDTSGYNGYWCNGACFSSYGAVCSSASYSCSASTPSSCSYLSASCPTGGSTTPTSGSTTCSSCVATGYWCVSPGGVGACYSTWSSTCSAASTVSSYCYAAGPSGCSTLSYCPSSSSSGTSTGGSSTGGSSTGTGGGGYYPSTGTSSTSLADLVSLDKVEDAKNAVAAGVAASVVVGFAFALLIITTSCCCQRTPPPSATGQLWKARAATAATTISVGVFFQAVGLVTGLAAPAIPWFSMAFFGFTQVATATTITLKGYGITASSIIGSDVGGAIIAYIGLIFFLFPAIIMAWSALYLLVTVSKFGGGPMTHISCCLPSLPAIQGLSWAGSTLFLGGAVWDWYVFGKLRNSFGGGVGPGGSLMAASFVCLFVASLCFSVAGCCQLGNFPGVGTARANCCCPEKDVNAIPAEASYNAPVTAPPAPPGLKLQNVYVGTAV